MLNNNKKIGVLPIGILLTTIIGSFLAYNLFQGDKSLFLAGETTHGHYQIELECSACHASPFASESDMQLACESCHGKALEKVSDSHPKKAFTDPRNAELLKKLDARMCVTCHKEHKPELTRNDGLTLATDFCFHCHKDIEEERPSHKDFEFKTCATSGCHNFHDNTMLYEKFLTKSINQSSIKKKPVQPKKSAIKRWLKRHKLKSLPQPESPQLTKTLEIVKSSDPELSEIIIEGWQRSVHAKVSVNCNDCHTDDLSDNKLSDSVLATKICADCHEKHSQSFLEGKHGMRLAQNLSPMKPSMGRLEVENQNDSELDCSSCHNPHTVDVRKASVEACLGCHQDEHSQSYKQSKHFQIWLDSTVSQNDEERGVSCASCHLPRIKKGKRVDVNHNQNFNLSPNTKMLRTVCMNCHGMPFSLSALSDEKLIKNNFQGKPEKMHETIELIHQRIKPQNTN